MNESLSLRPTVESDLPALYEQQSDLQAMSMVAFMDKSRSDREKFMQIWAKILPDETLTKLTILLSDEIVGNAAHFFRFGMPEVCYWIDRKHWGKGIATFALTELLKIVKMRPLYARVAHDNHGSIRVLQKCNFVYVKREPFFAGMRGVEVDELFFELK